MKSKIILHLVLGASVFFPFKNLFAQTCPLGSTDLGAVLKEAPSLPKRLEDAAKIAFGVDILQPDPAAMDNFYQPYEAKTRQKSQAYQAYSRQKMEQHATTSGNQAYENEAIKMANQSPIIAGMGGVENVKNMSAEEARAAAMKAAANFQENPFGADGSAGMTALYQKIIADPVFAARFEKMSEAEREAELRKFMANDRPKTKTSAEIEHQKQQIEQDKLKTNRIVAMQEILLKISELQQGIAIAGQVFAAKIAAIEQSAHGAHGAVDTDFSKKLARIPMIISGEMQIPDPALEHPLRRETALCHREIARIDLPSFAAALAELYENYQRVAAEYTIFLQENRHKIFGGTSMQDMIQGLNTELPMVSLEANLIELGMELSKQSRILTEKTALWEKHFWEVQAQYK